MSDNQKEEYKKFFILCTIIVVIGLLLALAFPSLGGPIGGIVALPALGAIFALFHLL